jgi:hypothetical protein
VPLVVVALLSSCTSAPDSSSNGWSGTIDTLPSGEIITANPAVPLWGPGENWQVTEELRIGAVEGDGPAVFGNIAGLEVDPTGRIWVLDGQAQHLRVFGPSGDYVRTVARKGSGPGELARAMRIDLGPDGHLWVMDPQNNRLSVFDTVGQYVGGITMPGGFLLFPWPGGFDQQGNYYAPQPLQGNTFGFELLRYDVRLDPVELTPRDTLQLPRDPIQRERFELRGNGGGLQAGVPFQGRLVWRLAPAGTIWALITDQYRLLELGLDGDTLRTITREFTPIPVTAADRDQAREDLKWFTEQGGQVDWWKIPETKPLVTQFFLDDEGDIWVVCESSGAEGGTVADVFDPQGRYLGAVALPFALAEAPLPIVRNSVLYGVVRDELDVPYVVRARITRPSAR